MSTLSEIAANLLKRERLTEEDAANIAALDAIAWDELMAFSTSNVAQSEEGAGVQRKRGITVLRLIQGGLAS